MWRQQKHDWSFSTQEALRVLYIRTSIPYLVAIMLSSLGMVYTSSCPIDRLLGYRRVPTSVFLGCIVIQPVQIYACVCMDGYGWVHGLELWERVSLTIMFVDIFPIFTLDDMHIIIMYRETRNAPQTYRDTFGLNVHIILTGVRDDKKQYVLGQAIVNWLFESRSYTHPPATCVTSLCLVVPLFGPYIVFLEPRCR